MLRVIGLAGAIAVLAGAACAADQWTGCYQNVLDANALRNNPRAALRVFGIQILDKDSDVSLTTYPARIKAAARSGAKTFTGEAVCILSGGRLNCQLDNDDGNLILTRSADGLKVDNPSKFFLHEQGGGADEVEVKGDRDNRSFNLAAAKPAACTGALPR